MAKRGESKELYTASEVAQFCQVDLKTIHNWADRGEIRHFRTPGRHLRFRAADVLEFLRKFGYPVPEQLKAGKPRVHVIDEDPASREALERALSGRFEVQSFAEPIDAFVALGSNPPDVLVIDAGTTKLDALAAIKRLRSMPSTEHVKVIVHSARTDLRQLVLDAGAAMFIPKPDANRVGESIDAVLAAS
jgi:excisionase family DNA binding protein